MPISARPYRDETDLLAIQAATAEWIAAAGFRGYLNPSDIALRLYNGMRRYNRGEIVRLWEESHQGLVGFGFIYPAWNSYAVLLHPSYRQHTLAAEMIDWAEREIVDQIRKAGGEDTSIRLDVFDGDSARIALLEQRGYARAELAEMITIRPLDQPIPQPQLPDGFTIRSLQGAHEASNLVTLINDSFGWHWTAEAYVEVLRSPGYPIENELVVVAPDGQFAASCILLPDTRNRTGMFENVGTKSSFRRLGLAKAMLYAGMHRMRAQGFTLAMVPHIEDAAATALYTSVGFKPAYTVHHYRRDALR